MARFITPVSDRITQNFGDNPDYYKALGQNGHTGIDYACWVGTPVCASGDGIVAFEGDGRNHNGFLNVAGIAVLIDHTDVYTGYAHLTRTIVNLGQRVKQGEVIGYSGATGQVMGPHLHFEFWGKPTNWKNGWAGRVNPNNYLAEGGASMAQITRSDAETFRNIMRVLNSEAKGWSRDEVHSGKWDEREVNYLAGMNKSAINAIAEYSQQAWNEGAAYRAAKDTWRSFYDQYASAVGELSERPTKAELEALTAKLAGAAGEVESAQREATAAEEEARQAIAGKVKFETQANADREAGDTLLRRLGQFVSKYLGGSK